MEGTDGQCLIEELKCCSLAKAVLSLQLPSCFSGTPALQCSCNLCLLCGVFWRLSPS